MREVCGVCECLPFLLTLLRGITAADWVIVVSGNSTTAGNEKQKLLNSLEANPDMDEKLIEGSVEVIYNKFQLNCGQKMELLKYACKTWYDPALSECRLFCPALFRVTGQQCLIHSLGTTDECGGMADDDREIKALQSRVLDAINRELQPTDERRGNY